MLHRLAPPYSCGYAAVSIQRHSREDLITTYGKAQLFRTSGGTAEDTTRTELLTIRSFQRRAKKRRSVDRGNI